MGKQIDNNSLICEEIISQLKKYSNPRNVEGMARFGISSKNTLGISIPILRKTAKSIGKNHQLALDLWDSGIHEARILAALIDEPAKVTSIQMDKWVADFDSWDVCDQVCMNLFDKSEFTDEKIGKWAKDEREYVRRAAFALIAALSFHDKNRSDKNFEKFFPLIQKYSIDERNFVKKAVNWALRQIGKRNQSLMKKAILCAEDIEKMDSRSARWIAKDALRELRGRLK
jgi:3-methyladenine DNA glycosylase AlkD